MKYVNFSKEGMEEEVTYERILSFNSSTENAS